MEITFILRQSLQELLMYQKKLDIPFHFHALRHNFTTNLINNGVKPNIVKELVRHGDIATTLGIYTHVNNDDLSKTIEEIYGKEDK